MKHLLLSATLSLLLLLSACGSSPAPSKTPNLPGTTATPPPLAETKAPAAPGLPKFDQELLPYEYGIPEKNILLNVPAWPQIEGSGDVFHKPEELFVMVTYGDSDSVAKNTEITTLLEPATLYNVGGNCLGEETGVRMDESETITVNDVEVLRYTGAVESDWEDGNALHNYICKGYDFIMDSTPCRILGVVSSEDQEQEFVDEMTKVVDEMIKSIRPKEAK